MHVGKCRKSPSEAKIHDTRWREFALKIASNVTNEWYSRVSEGGFFFFLLTFGRCVTSWTQKQVPKHTCKDYLIYRRCGRYWETDLIDVQETELMWCTVLLPLKTLLLFAQLSFVSERKWWLWCFPLLVINSKWPRKKQPTVYFMQVLYYF